ncbi:unnamed protein product [Effrenium voratum]|nr:unnamed protein product [Effrenium voratum]|mmetsp:Transcript_29733/g.70682  ORF Transcript_29733/g.70682 Transcript_29733/m.70682 type:complete len:1126 (-) Transcript_29733:22-3399(-)
MAQVRVAVQDEVKEEEDSDDEDAEAGKEKGLAPVNRNLLISNVSANQPIVNSYRSDEDQGSDDSDEGVPHAENAAALLENDVSNMLTRDKNQAGVERSDLEKTLEKLGFRVVGEEEDTDDDAAVGVRRHSVANSADADTCQELMVQLFPGKRQSYKIHPQHLGLPAVLRHVFVAQEELLKRSAQGVVESSSMKVAMKKAEAWLRTRICGPRALKVSRFLQQITNRKPFIIFFFLLTVYVLIFPDLIHICTDSDADEPLLTANTVVFFLFLFELILIVCVEGSYILSIPFVLDAVSLVSLFLDTWFVAEIAVDSKGSSLSRLARSSRIARIARIGRVARVTKLIPRVLKLCRKQSNALAEQLLLRRLWRLFQYLDTAGEGKLSVFDLKIFYLALLQECPHVRPDKVDVATLLSKDKDLLLSRGQTESGEIVENEPILTVEDFSGILMETGLGVHLVEFHRHDLESDGGSVWALTQRLSDSTAMKVCVGILALVATMSLLEVDTIDHAPSHGLAQLDKMARDIHLQGSSDDWTYLCVQIDVYKKHNDLMYLYLDGWEHYDNEQCLRVGAGASSLPVASALTRTDELVVEAKLRQTEIERACWQPNQYLDCEDLHLADANRTVSLALVDLSAKAKDASFWSLMMVLAVLFQIPLSVYVLNLKISTFSTTLLQPLRSLVDDMVAMSSLELVGIDDHTAPGMLSNKTKGVKTAEELENLNTAFRAMRSAIRSWSLFVPPSVVERFYDAGLEAEVGMTRCEVTVLFCDIEGFEETCRELDPDAVLNNLTGVLGTIADEIQLQSGTFLEFISDEVMAVFNAPNKLPNHASAGLLCAVAIQKAVRKHTVRVGHEEKPIRCRVGIHSASILAGNIGSHQRIKYGLLGDGVNLAARMKGLNSRYSTCTLCSQNALHLSSQQNPLPLATRPVDLVAVKGKTEPTKVFEVMGFMADHPSLAEAVKRHSYAFELYLARKFKEAMEKFEEVSSLLAVADFVDDETSQMMICRCEEYIKNSPPPEWDGVEHLKSKSFGGAQRQKAAPKDVELAGNEQEQKEAKAAQEMANGMLPDETRVVAAEEEEVSKEEETTKPSCAPGCTWNSMLCRTEEDAGRSSSQPWPQQVHVHASSKPEMLDI